MTKTTTREEILDTSVKMMLQKGYNATSVGEICKAINLTKGGFFYHFSSKEELASETLKHFWRPMKNFLENGLSQVSIDPLQRIFYFIDLIIEDLKKAPSNSCLFGNLAQELSYTHEQLRKECDAAFTWWSEIIMRELETAKKIYIPEDNVNIQSLADHFLVVYEGTLILAKAKQDDAVIATQLEHYKHYIAQIFKHNE